MPDRWVTSADELDAAEVADQPKLAVVPAEYRKDELRVSLRELLEAGDGATPEQIERVVTALAVKAAK